MAKLNRSLAPWEIGLRGLGMGMADVVPGFSGGTVALITGIYARLVASISRFDGSWLSYLRRREWKRAFQHVDGKFLVALALGIAFGFAVTLLTIHRLLDQETTRPFVLAAFLGMVLGSAVFVWRMVRAESPVTPILVALVIGGALTALVVCLLPAGLTTEPPLWYVFLCGAIAICAMILPGISGALILVLLGTYQYFTGIAREILGRENLVEGLLVSAVFGAGCLTGLAIFSRLLRFLFHRFPAATLAFLFGLMLGSTIRLWPFQELVERKVGELVVEDHRLIWPATWQWNEWLLLATVGLAAMGVLLVIGFATRRQDSAGEPEPNSGPA